ncbi:MAG TPA: 2-phosphosulfolactate phosphatase [Trueperaceae bacterium]|nr:2-phosphosulfolactate phosphatase [Trueperaceae bacterium]
MQLQTDLIPNGPYGDVVVLIDVLRTSTVAPLLFDNGLNELGLTASVRRARAAAAERPGTLLMGERDGLPPEGFNHGAAPAELRRHDFTGRSAILMTENAPRAAAAVAGADHVLLGSLYNAHAVAAAAARLAKTRISLVCCGFGGEPDLDDCLAAGLIAGLLMQQLPPSAGADEPEPRGAAGDAAEPHGASGGAIEPRGATRFALGMLRSYTDPLVALWHSTAGTYLRGLGSDEDLALAAATSVSSSVPELRASDNQGVAPLFRFTVKEQR